MSGRLAMQVKDLKPGMKVKLAHEYGVFTVMQVVPSNDPRWLFIKLKESASPELLRGNQELGSWNSIEELTNV
jgi:hypothetical protein